MHVPFRILLIALSTTLVVHPFFAQETESDKSDPLINLQIGYRAVLKPGKVIRSGNGIFIEPHLFLNKWLPARQQVSVFGGWGWQDRLRNSGFEDQFSSDYGAEINQEKNSGFADSSLIRASASLFAREKGRSEITPGCNTFSFHDYDLYYGISFRLAYRFHPQVKIYHGHLRSHYQGPSNETDYEIFQLRRKYFGGDLSASTNLRRNKSSSTKLGLALFLHYITFRDASLYFDNGETRKNIRLARFTGGEFRDKYHGDLRCGLRVFFVFQ